MYDIVTNYAVDTKNVALFDQNKSLSFDNADLQEYQLNFAEVEAYNNKKVNSIFKILIWFTYSITINSIN